MKRKLRIVAIVALIAGVLLGGSGLLGEPGGEIVGLCSLTIAINWLMIYSAMHSLTGEKVKGKEKVLAVLSALQYSIPICALFWAVLGNLIWPENRILITVSSCLAIPCLLTMPARKQLFSVDGVAFNIKLPGVSPIIVTIIVIGIVFGGVLIGIRSCAKNSEEKEYVEALENVEVEVYDEYFNDSTGKFDFAIRLKNGTPYTLKNMCFAMKVYDETGVLLVDTIFYLPNGAPFSPGEERCFYVYVNQNDVESVKTLYYSDFDSLNIQMWIVEVEYEEYDSPLSTEYSCFNKPSVP
jgi:hypothetical protein